MNKVSGWKKIFALIMIISILAGILAGCKKEDKVKLDPKNPVTISIWHYYNGAVMNAFDQLVKEFNESVGVKEGIIVESFGMGNVSELETAVLSSAKKEVGSKEIPNIFASYADTAYEAEQLNILADLDKYFSKEEQAEYIVSYIEEGKIGTNGELRIFPIAKSTEIFMLNETDWKPFADANGFTHDDLTTNEGVAKVAKKYYEWTDAATPNVANDGKAFWGRDSIPNMFIIGAKQFGVEIFEVTNGKVKINAEKDTIRKIWDSYYVPYMSGYFMAAGKYRSDDTKVGDIISYVGSTSSSMYFPNEVTLDGKSHAVEAVVLPTPVFEGQKNVLVQQGAGMAVTKSTPEEEYASTVFLKWFTDTDVNIRFSAHSGYMPVKKEANSYEKFMSVVDANGIKTDKIASEALAVAFENVQKNEMYTSKAFEGGAAARTILENHLKDKADADRATVVQSIKSGKSHAEAVAQFDTNENFEAWFTDITAQLNAAVAKS